MDHVKGFYLPMRKYRMKYDTDETSKKDAKNGNPGNRYFSIFNPPSRSASADEKGWCNSQQLAAEKEPRTRSGVQYPFIQTP